MQQMQARREEMRRPKPIRSNDEVRLPSDEGFHGDDSCPNSLAILVLLCCAPTNAQAQLQLEDEDLSVKIGGRTQELLMPRAA